MGKTLTISQTPKVDESPITPEVIKEKSRQNIAYLVIVAYIILISLNIILPLVIFFSYWPAENSIQLTDIKDLMIAISGVLSGFVSILGFIVGYYFKAVEGQAKTEQEEQLQKNHKQK